MFTILGAWLLADFFSGVVHWAEDRFLTSSSRFKFLNEIKNDNDLHHKSPIAMTKFSMCENISTSAIFTLPLFAFLLAIGAPHILTLAIFFSTFANLVHRFAHEPPAKEINPMIRFMQWTGFFISFENHKAHHYGPGLLSKEEATISYCPMTNFLNPILDRLGFWSKLELVVRSL